MVPSLNHFHDYSHYYFRYRGLNGNSRLGEIVSSVRDLCNAADDDCTKLGMIFNLLTTGISDKITLEQQIFIPSQMKQIKKFYYTIYIYIYMNCFYNWVICFFLSKLYFGNQRKGQKEISISVFLDYWISGFVLIFLNASVFMVNYPWYVLVVSPGRFFVLMSILD